MTRDCEVALHHPDFVLPSSRVIRASSFQRCFQLCHVSVIRIICGELIPKRIFPKREVPAIEHKVLIEPICQSGFPLHLSYRCGLLGCGEGFREPTALCISSCQRPEKAWFCTT